MDLISLQGKTNFFEKRVSDYAKAHVRPSKGGKGLRVKLYVLSFVRIRFSFSYGVGLIGFVLLRDSALDDDF